MTESLNIKPPYLVGHYIPTVGPIKGFCEEWKPWRAPRLTEAGREFKPKRNKPGAEVLFDYNGVRMRGQVWSAGPHGNELWVVREGQAYLVRGVW